VKQLALAIFRTAANIRGEVTPMRSRLFLSFLVSLLAGSASAEPAALSPPVQPSTTRTVIELFTSQGCSSCPPADALLKTYIDRDDVIALSLPVDYWDYIGWKDTLASPRNTERQRSYAQKFGIGPVYTPQVVVNGRAQMLGSDREQIDRAIGEAAKAASTQTITLHVWNFSNSIAIEVGAALADADVKDATIWLAVVQKSVDVPVKHGENAGKTLTYYNVVRELTPVGLWNGRPTTIRLARGAIMQPDTEDLIVILQENSTGPILAAAHLGD
jgi:hypothetical protein